MVYQPLPSHKSWGIGLADGSQLGTEKQLVATKMELWFLVICLLTLVSSSQCQSTEGFISIDCGLDGTDNYTLINNIKYSPDALYIDTGVNRTLRSFPNGTRNCYTLRPLVKGSKYLVRAEFEYGDFDGRNSPPSFDVYLGVHFWQTVGPYIFDRLEIIVVSPGESMQLCLVNKGLGTPYITVLEVRPLLDSMYPLVDASQALVLRGDRRDHGTNRSTRYPQDPYDRAWFAPQEGKNWVPIITDQTIKDGSGKFFTPASVLSTALRTPSLSQSLNFTVKGNPGEEIYVFMHFAELQALQSNETREFDIYANGSLLFRQYRPNYLLAETLTSRQEMGGTIFYSLKATGNSTLPPMINALEAHALVRLSALPTQENDINAIIKIRDYYKLRKNWVGDPCEPKNFTWEGVSCSNDDSQNHRIVALNLSHWELGGGISPYISDLSALVSLDLSSNNLTGEIPSELVKLSNLQVLNLSSNQLEGQIPPILVEKSQNKILTLRIEGNSNLCSKDSCQGTNGNKGKKGKSILLPIVISIGALVVIVFVLIILIWRIKRRKENNREATPQVQSSSNILELHSRTPQENLHSDSSQFTFADIVSITKNFQNQIGKGGFGVVYHGFLRNGVEVAVKRLSKISSQGPKEFQAEARILTRVHHKNLVSLLGYCDEKNNLVLVYEFMAHGTLKNNLSGHMNNHLSWRIRLRIAIDVAQGLDYLHSFCKPPIVHRDVKSTNILLNENMEAKLADFGLSRLFHGDDSAYVSTVVAGTPGYLDPEYHQTLKLNMKSDIYSFGVVLLELISGKYPIFGGSEKISLVSWVQSKIERGDITQIVDQQLHGEYDISSVWKYIEIAMSCTSRSSIHRPSMSDVVMRLKECQTSMSSQDISTGNEDQVQSSGDIGNVFSYHGINPSVR